MFIFGAPYLCRSYDKKSWDYDGEKILFYLTQFPRLVKCRKYSPTCLQKYFILTSVYTYAHMYIDHSQFDASRLDLKTYVNIFNKSFPRLTAFSIN